MAFRHYGPLRVLYPRPGLDLDPARQSALGTVYFMIVKKELSYPGLEALYTDPTAWLAKAGENADLYRLKLGFKKPTGNGPSSAPGWTPSGGLDSNPDKMNGYFDSPIWEGWWACSFLIPENIFEKFLGPWLKGHRTD